MTDTPTIITTLEGGSVHLKDVGVSISNLDPKLILLLRILGPQHQALFNRPLVVTSGNDGEHAPNSKHYIGKAVDLRATDKTNEETVVFLELLVYLARVYGLAVFDERAQPAAGHIHVEVAG